VGLSVPAAIAPTSIAIEIEFLHGKPRIMESISDGFKRNPMNQTQPHESKRRQRDDKNASHEATLPMMN
jgi:hypothetical protein